MIQPMLAGQDLLADIAHAHHKAGHLHLWWLGQSGFLVQWQGRHLLFDPYLSDSLTHKYAATDKPHIRMTAQVIAPEQLDFVNVVTSSHNHTDHLDAETLRPLMAANPAITLVIPEANRAFVAERLQCDLAWPIGLDDSASTTVGPFTITALPAAHEQLEQDAAGRHRFLGYVVQCGRWIIYHSGDTVWYAGMVERLRQWAIDVAILPINGRSPERRVAGNLNGNEAAVLARQAGIDLVIPCHYDMFAFNTANPEDEFIPTCKAIGQPHRVLRNGEGVTL